MQLKQLITAAVDHFIGRILRLTLLAVLIAVFALAAIYHFAAAGTVALEAKYGLLYAQLIIGAIFAAAAGIVFAVMAAMRSSAKVKITNAKALDSPHASKLAMLIEAAMLGYALSRKGGRTR